MKIEAKPLLQCHEFTVAIVNKMNRVLQGAEFPKVS